MVQIKKSIVDTYNGQIQSISIDVINKIYKNLSEGILITDEHKKIITVNPAFEKVTGYILDEVVGYSPSILKSGVHDSSFYKQIWDTIRTNGIWEGEIWNRRKTGELYPEWLSIVTIRNEQGNLTNYCGIFTDLSERKKIEDRLEKQQFQDHLMEISNRYSYIEQMKDLLNSSQKSTKHAVFFLNINRFKQVNETFGNFKGDQLLVEVGNRIKSLLKSKDILARYSGDEFVFTVTNILTTREAALFANAVIKKVAEPIIINNNEISVSLSVGISLFPEDGTTVDQLIMGADKAMIYSRENNRTGFSFFFDELNTDANRELLLEQELRKAIDQKEFELHYQPKVDLKTLKIVGVEALVRWNNEKLGYVSPNEFIEYAEGTGLIIPISEIIFEKACEGYAAIAKEGYGDISIAVNISSVHFSQEDFLDSIKNILERHNTTANHFEIELTERTVMNSLKETISKLVRLKQLGFKLSIDDFGTGYSSLSYLVRFPIDVLKIDRSFIQHITSLDEQQTIVDTIIQMSKRLKMKVVAEGVELSQQATMLQQMGCDYVQGYYYSKPIPLVELIEFLQYWEEEHEERN